MTIERLFAAQLGHPRTTTAYPTRRRPCVYHWFGVSGTAWEWVEDGLAVLIGLALVMEIGAILAMVAGR